MSTAPLQQAVQIARTLVAEVRPEHLTLPTPCASWTVTELIEHMLGSHAFFAAAMNGTPPPESAPAVAGGELAAAFDAATAETLAAFEADGAMERTVTVPFGSFPATVFVGFAVNDIFAHAWDLAKALGRETDLAPDLAAALLEASRTSIPDSFRGPDAAAPFGAEQPAPAGASNADRLAAFLGRKV